MAHSSAVKKMIKWLFIWGEIEQQRLACGDLAAVQLSTDPAGKARGGYTMPNCLLIHAEIERVLGSPNFGGFVRSLMATKFVDGWEWAEILEQRTSRKGGKPFAVPTGKFGRQLKGNLRRHQERMIEDLTKQMAELLFTPRPADCERKRPGGRLALESTQALTTDERIAATEYNLRLVALALREQPDDTDLLASFESLKGMLADLRGDSAA